jgi:hypothetical protein
MARQSGFAVTEQSLPAPNPVPGLRNPSSPPLFSRDRGFG